MEESPTTRQTQPLAPEELPELFKDIPLLAHLRPEDLRCYEGAELVRVAKGEKLIEQGAGRAFFWVILEGKASVYKVTADGTRVHLMDFAAGDMAGEVPLLMGQKSPSAFVETLEDCRAVRISEEGFWRLMAGCPVVRAGVLENMAHRFERYQAVTFHREKLVALGTLAAGLMHELNNPGAAARRAASQLRENMTRLQAISLRLTRSSLSSEQMECVGQLQEQVFSLRKPPALSSLEQSDREEELSSWLEGLGVENPWRLAPTLVSVGWEQCDIACAQHSFPPQILSDTLNYLEALISSVQLVGTIEESIARVTDLVTAVKKYAYDDKRANQQIDVRDSLMSTLTILGHKFRQKQLTIEKSFSPEVSTIFCVGTGLAQVWTNLLDNAIDAAPEGSTIALRLWQEADLVCVGILDHGPGIPREHWEQIYQPFFTTKDVGVGTGLGLDIAHRIVVNNFHGDIQFTSEPGRTEFVVRLPVGEVCAIGSGGVAAKAPVAAAIQGASS
jgi:signal transduction histidine kinase